MNKGNVVGSKYANVPADKIRSCKESFDDDNNNIVIIIINSSNYYLFTYKFNNTEAKEKVSMSIREKIKHIQTTAVIIIIIVESTGIISIYFGTF
jgi:hypothetical protein